MTEAEKKGIKESKELMAALVVLAKAGYAIAKDKKVGLDDLGHLATLGKEFDTLLEGFKGLDELGSEIKDLDEVEAVELLTELFKGIKKVKGEA